MSIGITNRYKRNIMTINLAKHKIMLIKILKDVYSNPRIGPILGFKGGTAAFLFYELDRFSVDLDFDLLDISKEETVFLEMKNLLNNYGKIKTADSKRFSLIYILDYDEKDPGAQNIKVEINKRLFDSRYVVKSYLGIPMKVMIPEDMIANKMVAFYERTGKANRDIYDTWFFLSKNWAINKQLIEKRTGMSFKDFIQRNREQLEKINNRNILAGMGEVLSESQKVWVKKNLKKELLFELNLLLAS